MHGRPPEPDGDIDEGELTLDGFSLDPTLTDHGQLQGTLSYMSPEQVRRDPTIGPPSDIFSLGVVLYEILSGQLPHRGDRVDVVLNSILEGEVEPPSRVSSVEVPELLEAICLQCLDKQPARRVPSAGELVRELSENWRAVGRRA